MDNLAELKLLASEAERELDGLHPSMKVLLGPRLAQLRRMIELIRGL